MSKPDIGQKRVCAQCAARFYDLNRDPIVCPTCQAVFYVPPPLPLRPPRAPRRFQPYAPVAAVDPVSDEPAFDEAKEEKDEDTGDVLILDIDDNDEPNVEGVVVIDPELRQRDT